jgi:hypothetical protein
MWGFFLQMATYLLKFENFAVLSKNIRYYFDNKNFYQVDWTKIKKEKISHFKMTTLNSDVTVNSYNNLYLFQ